MKKRKTMNNPELKKGQEVWGKKCSRMGRKRFHEIDNRDHFIPVELISYSNAECHVKILTNSGDKDLVVPYIYQLERPTKPQKPVIPQFVADWIEECKEKNGYTLSDALSPYICPFDLDRWFYLDDCENEKLFAQAWLFGYDIEREQLYTVEIPNPNIDRSHITVLKRMEDSTIELCIFVRPDLSESKFQLTESEIKEDFEWAWEWAEPVEEN